MNDNKAKAKWVKPKLIVLVRGGQEDVLVGCKFGGAGWPTGPSGGWRHCYDYKENVGCHGNCFVWGPS